MKRPQCPVCGQRDALAPTEPKPIGLQSRQKKYTADGGHRAVSPEETFKNYEHHISPISGIVNAPQRTESEDESVSGSPIHVYLAGHNLAAERGSLGYFRRHFRVHSAGKGMSDMQAKAGALAESIERYSGLFQPEIDPRRMARYSEMDVDAMHPNQCMLYSETQYRERETRNKRGSRFQWIPEPFDDEANISWSPVWSLTEQKHKYLPTSFCYYSHHLPENETKFSWGCSNGNAAGNTIEEAILQGFLELVERDAVALWWYNRLPKAAVDLASFNEPYFIRLQEHYRAAFGRALWVLDITSDLGVPTFVAVSSLAGGEKILFGFGSHFEASIGVSRALTEMNQMIGVAGLCPSERAPSSKKAEKEDELAALADPTISSWLKNATLENQPYLRPAANLSRRSDQDYPPFESDDLFDDIKRCQRLAEEKGLEMLVLDQTRPDIGMPVVKVIVPGLRHFWERFAPGRLYDVPVAMGELSKPLTEKELNPIGMFV